MSARSIEREITVAELRARLGFPSQEQKERIIAEIQNRLARTYCLAEQNPGHSSFITFPGQNIATLNAPLVRTLVEENLAWWGPMQLQFQINPLQKETVLLDNVWLAFSDQEKRIKLSLNGGFVAHVSSEVVASQKWVVTPKKFEPVPLGEFVNSNNFADTQLLVLHPEKAQLLRSAL